MACVEAMGRYAGKGRGGRSLSGTTKDRTGYTHAALFVSCCGRYDLLGDFYNRSTGTQVCLHGTLTRRTLLHRGKHAVTLPPPACINAGSLKQYVQVTITITFLEQNPLTDQIQARDDPRSHGKRNPVGTILPIMLLVSVLSLVHTKGEGVGAHHPYARKRNLTSPHFPNPCFSNLPP